MLGLFRSSLEKEADEFKNILARVNDGIVLSNLELALTKASMKLYTTLGSVADIEALVSKNTLHDGTIDAFVRWLDEMIAPEGDKSEFGHFLAYQMMIYLLKFIGQRDKKATKKMRDLIATYCPYAQIL